MSSPPEQQSESAVVVVTGVSGAGKSTALRTLDDLGYYCVDNLPPQLVSATVSVCAEGGVGSVALGVDIRVGAFLDTAVAAIEEVDRRGHRLAVLFLDAADEVLVRRYSESRRPHPALPSDGHSERGASPDEWAVLDGIRLERERLAPIRSRATVVIDTTHLSVHELRRQVIRAYGPDPDAGAGMRVRLLSFGFKYGLPLDADLVFDVRFLDNPYFVPELREQSGLDEAVRHFVLRSSACTQFVGHVEQLLRFALPRYRAEGKSYLSIAIGCTGGRHRSVAIASLLAERLCVDAAAGIGVVHRDLDRGGMLSTAPSKAPPASDGSTEG